MMKQLLMQPALWLCVSMISYPDYWCFNKDTTFLHNSTILPHSEKRETALEPFPFQLIFVISSEVCFHHLLPGLVSDGDIGFQGIDNTKRVFPQFCGPQFCGSMVALPGGAGSRLSRQTAAHRRRLWATGTPIPVRQGPISAYGAPQSLAQRAEPASRCGCLATVRVTSRNRDDTRSPPLFPSRNCHFPFAELKGKSHICLNVTNPHPNDEEDHLHLQAGRQRLEQPVRQREGQGRCRR